MDGLFVELPVRKLGRGQILIYEGDTVENIFMLVKGYVKVSNILVNGNQRTIFIYTPGDAFPLTSFLTGVGVARYFYECITDVEVKVMPQKKFQTLIKGNTGTPKDQTTQINIPLTSQGIADMCGLTRETASMQLIRLKKTGVVTGTRLLSVNTSKLRKVLAT